MSFQGTKLEKPQGRTTGLALQVRKLAPSELDRIEREITATDEEIDELVYELYAITDEERKIIEAVSYG